MTKRKLCCCYTVTTKNLEWRSTVRVKRRGDNIEFVDKLSERSCPIIFTNTYFLSLYLRYITIYYNDINCLVQSTGLLLDLCIRSFVTTRTYFFE